MKPSIYHPRADDVVELPTDPLKQILDAITKLPESGQCDPQPGGGSELLLAIAKDEAEVYRRHLAALVDLWDAIGVMGFVCARQDKVTEFLAKLHEVKSIVRQ